MALLMKVDFLLFSGSGPLFAARAEGGSCMRSNFHAGMRRGFHFHRKRNASKLKATREYEGKTYIFLVVPTMDPENTKSQLWQTCGCCYGLPYVHLLFGFLVVSWLLATGSWFLAPGSWLPAPGY